jgi:hypothetical protein
MSDAEDEVELLEIKLSIREGQWQASQAEVRRLRQQHQACRLARHHRADEARRQLVESVRALADRHGIKIGEHGCWTKLAKLRLGPRWSENKTHVAREAEKLRRAFAKSTSTAVERDPAIYST